MISTIHSNHKFITSLDLNFLDIKFKSLKKQKIEIKPSVIGTKNVTLPFLNNNKNINDTTLDGTSIISTPLYRQTNIPQNIDLYDYIQSIERIKKQKIKTLQKTSKQKILTNTNRYKKMIKTMKKQNQLLHKHISKLHYQTNQKTNFRSNAIVQDNTNLQMGTIKGIKHVKNLRLLTNTNQNNNQSVENSPFRQASNTLNSCVNFKKCHKGQLSINKYGNLYENLYDQEKGENGKSELENLKKKILNNNLDKSLQTYFIQNKIRIPQFIKRLR